MSLKVFDDASRTISASLRISQIMTPEPSLSCLTTRDGEKAKQLSLVKKYDVTPITQNGVICSGLDALRDDVMHTANPTLLARGVPNLLDRRQRLIQLIRTCEEAMRKSGLR